MDPPVHAPWRQLVSRRFTPRATATLEGRGARGCPFRARRDLDRGETSTSSTGSRRRSRCSSSPSCSGSRDADRDDFRRWSDAAISSTDTDDAGARRSRRAVPIPHRPRRRAAGPEPGTDDIVSALATRRDRRATREHRRCGRVLPRVARRRQRDDASSRLGRRARAVATSRTTRRCSPPSRSRIATRGRGMPALGDTDPGVRPHGHARHRARADSDCAQATGSCCSTRRRTATRRIFGPTADRFDVTRPRRFAVTSRSDSASTSASARRWRGSKARVSCSRSCSSVSPRSTLPASPHGSAPRSCAACTTSLLPCAE